MELKSRKKPAWSRYQTELETFTGLRVIPQKTEQEGAWIVELYCFILKSVWQTRMTSILV
jgi:hypothetical protein